MSYLRTHCTVLGCTLLLMVGLSAQTLAQSTAPKGGEPYGDWETKVTVNRKQRTSVLSLYSDPKGNQTGQWVSLQKLGELKDLTSGSLRKHYLILRAYRQNSVILQKYSLTS